MRIGNRDFDTDNHTYVMGILNVTPDSFWDGGRYRGMDVALGHVAQMIRDGADIIDIGGESTRPGATPVEAADEIERVLPVIEAVRDRFDIPVSLDTYKNTVAWAGIGAGVDMINDVWGLKGDERMAEVIAQSHVPVCIMHNRENEKYSDIVTDVISDLKNSIEIASKAGIPDENIMIDPGIGFAKDHDQNMKLMAHLGELRSLGYPVLLGTSRKSMIGLALDLPADERLEGGLATTAWGMMHGVSFVRVHDVKEHVRVIRMIEAIRACR
ncbi:MAG: dihydropteroate synthase [Lachnospiraceae bacterium]|nr:dihydropteroate synthase [Lachnospiraceae bacterium]